MGRSGQSIYQERTAHAAVSRHVPPGQSSAKSHRFHCEFAAGDLPFACGRLDRVASASGVPGSLQPLGLHRVTVGVPRVLPAPGRRDVAPGLTDLSVDDPHRSLLPPVPLEFARATAKVTHLTQA